MKHRATSLRQQSYLFLLATLQHDGSFRYSYAIHNSKALVLWILFSFTQAHKIYIVHHI